MAEPMLINFIGKRIDAMEAVDEQAGKSKAPNGLVLVDLVRKTLEPMDDDQNIRISAHGTEDALHMSIEKMP